MFFEPYYGNKCPFSSLVTLTAIQLGRKGKKRIYNSTGGGDCIFNFPVPIISINIFHLVTLAEKKRTKKRKEKRTDERK